MLAFLAEGNTVGEASREFDIPVKNIKRWRETGIRRKRGAGRKRIDPEMEEQLFAWLRATYAEGALVEQETVRERALQLCSKPEFMASKGWLAKFSRRYFVKELYNLV